MNIYIYNIIYPDINFSLYNIFIIIYIYIWPLLQAFEHFVGVAGKAATKAIYIYIYIYDLFCVTESELLAP